MDNKSLFELFMEVLKQQEDEEIGLNRPSIDQ